MANGKPSFLGAVITVAIGTMVGIWAYKKIDRVEDKFFDHPHMMHHRRW